MGLLRCIGFGAREYHCTNTVAGSKQLWCPECEELRREHITKQMLEIEAQLEARLHELEEEKRRAEGSTNT